jgi:hypothetical protein
MFSNSAWDKPPKTWRELNRRIKATNESLEQTIQMLKKMNQRIKEKNAESNQP